MNTPFAEQLALDLSAQSVAVAAAAESACGQDRDVLAAGSRSLALAARRANDKAKADEPPILVLDHTAGDAVITAARVRRAVRRGKDVYLPLWSELAVGLPNALLRSSLWTAGETSDEWREGHLVECQGSPNVELRYTGRQLSQHDRRVFSACLDYYRLDRPLSPGGDMAPWVQVSFYEMAQAMGNAYTLNTHKALRLSLTRLEAATLRLRIGNLDLPIPRLLEVAFAEGYGELDDPDLKGSDKIAFRVLEQFAQLYGPTTWSSVPKPALEMRGMKGWLCGYYSTHKSAMAIPFERLRELSGLMGTRPNDFRARLCKVLDELQADDVPLATRVASYTVSEDRKSITVRMARWGKKYKA